MTQPCQSITRPTDTGRVFPCQNRAADVLFGVHLCLTHMRLWRTRLEQNEKIKVHPERALPVHTVLETKCCTMCGESKTPDQFYAHASMRDGLHPACKACCVERNRRNRADARLRAEGTAEGAAPAPRPVSETKVCPRCKEVKPRPLFFASTGRPRTYCPPCNRAIALASWRKRHPPSLAVTRPGAQPPPEHQDARPPEREPQSLSVLADADLSGLPVVPADDEIFPSVGLVSEAPASLPDRPLPPPTPEAGVSPGPQVAPAEELTKAVNPESRAARAPSPLLTSEYTWTAKPFVTHPVHRNAQVVTLVDEPTRAGGPQPDRACRGHTDQIGGKRCVRCCTAKDLSYVWRNAAGGSPGGWRWLCAACQAVYAALGLVGEHRIRVEAFTDGFAARTAVGLDAGLNRFGQFKDAADISA